MTLAVPETGERQHFGRNFITQAVCELRFPTLFELEQDRPPAEFANALRKEYPSHERANHLIVGQGRNMKAQQAHVFRSRKDRWTVNLRPSSVSLETSHYDCFEEFEERLTFTVSAALKVIDTEYFTRIGLRYVNGLPCGSGDKVEGWVNPKLIGALPDGVFGIPDEMNTAIVGKTEIGGFGFRHGFGKSEKTSEFVYVMDYDLFVDDAPASDAIGIVRKLHDLQHTLFRWSLGPKAFDYLAAK